MATTPMKNAMPARTRRYVNIAGVTIVPALALTTVLAVSLHAARYFLPIRRDGRYRRKKNSSKDYLARPSHRVYYMKTNIEIILQ
jgi:hypothetical protein